MQKNIWMIYLSLFSIFLPLLEITETKALTTNKIYLAEESSAYNQYMQQGYVANSQRNYRKALGLFQQALNARPGDRYATAAIKNVNRYIQGNSHDSISFHIGKPERTVPGAVRGGVPDNLAEENYAYNQYMQQGYIANSQRNYRKALGLFQQALNARPGDRYATTAINNVNHYLKDKSHSGRIGFYVGKPGRTVSAAIRGPLRNQDSPIVLEPTNEEPQLTTVEYPKFFFYIPKTTAHSLEFSLTDDSNSSVKILYKATFNPPKNLPGIVSISLPKNSNPKLSPLAIDKIYNWNLMVIYDQENYELNPVIQGKIQRIQPDQNLNLLLESAKSPQEQVSLYTTSGIWEDSLRILASLRLSRPRDRGVESDWQDLLRSPWEYLLQSPTLEPVEKQNLETSMKAVIKAPLVDVSITSEEINP